MVAILITPYMCHYLPSKSQTVSETLEAEGTQKLFIVIRIITHGKETSIEKIVILPPYQGNE